MKSLKLFTILSFLISNIVNAEGNLIIKNNKNFK